MTPSLTEAWEMMKEMVNALSGDPYLYNLNKPGEKPGIGKENEEKLHALIEHIDEYLGTKEEKVCCYPGKECKCCDRGECKTCCYCT